MLKPPNLAILENFFDIYFSPQTLNNRLLYVNPFATFLSLGIYRYQTGYQTTQQPYRLDAELKIDGSVIELSDSTQRFKLWELCKYQYLN